MSKRQGALVTGKLGKLPPKHDKRTLRFAKYIDHGILPQIPAHKNWGTGISSWPMMMNDQLGCCTCAAVGHQIQAWTANVGRESVVTDTDILGLYSLVSGYNVATGSGDVGAYELDVLNTWQKVGIAGHKIDAYVALEVGNHDHIRIATFLFGGCYVGLALPLAVLDSTDVWSVVGGEVGVPGSLGGHAVPIVGYDALTVTCVTWGRLQRMTYGFLSAYMDEAYAVLSAKDWLGLSPSGLDARTLRDDLHLVQSAAPPQPVPVAKATS